MRHCETSSTNMAGIPIVALGKHWHPPAATTKQQLDSQTEKATELQTKLDDANAKLLDAEEKFSQARVYLDTITVFNAEQLQDTNDEIKKLTDELAYEENVKQTALDTVARLTRSMQTQQVELNTRERKLTSQTVKSKRLQQNITKNYAEIKKLKQEQRTAQKQARESEANIQKGQASLNAKENELETATAEIENANGKVKKFKADLIRTRTQISVLENALSAFAPLRLQIDFISGASPMLTRILKFDAKKHAYAGKDVSLQFNSKDHCTLTRTLNPDKQITYNGPPDFRPNTGETVWEATKSSGVVPSRPEPVTCIIRTENNVKKENYALAMHEGLVLVLKNIKTGEISKLTYNNTYNYYNDTKFDVRFQLFDNAWVIIDKFKPVYQTKQATLRAALDAAGKGNSDYKLFREQNYIELMRPIKKSVEAAGSVLIVVNTQTNTTTKLTLDSDTYQYKADDMFFEWRLGGGWTLCNTGGTNLLQTLKRELMDVLKQQVFSPYEFISQRDYGMRDVKLVVVKRENFEKIALLRSISATEFKQEGTANEEGYTFTRTAADEWTLYPPVSSASWVQPDVSDAGLQFTGGTLDEVLSAGQASLSRLLVYREQVFNNLGNKLHEKTKDVEDLRDQLNALEKDAAQRQAEFTDLTAKLASNKTQIAQKNQKLQEFTDLVQVQKIELSKKTSSTLKLQKEIKDLRREAMGPEIPKQLHIEIDKSGVIFTDIAKDTLQYDVDANEYEGKTYILTPNLNTKRKMWTILKKGDVQEGDRSYLTPFVPINEIIKYQQPWQDKDGTSAPKITITQIA